LAEVLAAIPDVGKDKDFERIEDAAEAQRVPGWYRRYQRVAQEGDGEPRGGRLLQRGVVEFGDSVLAFDADAAQVWGRLRVPHPENPLDKQIAATALVHDLVLVTRNVKLFNPFVE
jgi:hypothetical protein